MGHHLSFVETGVQIAQSTVAGCSRFGNGRHRPDRDLRVSPKLPFAMTQMAIAVHVAMTSEIAALHMQMLMQKVDKDAQLRWQVSS